MRISDWSSDVCSSDLIKRAIFGEVGKVLGPQAILASNTSSIPITRLAQAAPDAARFAGVHFFNPVPVMGLIELIRGLATSDETVAAVEGYAQALGKKVVHANDAPGFIVNRILLPMQIGRASCRERVCQYV